MVRLTPIVWLHFDALLSEYFSMNFGKSDETEIGEFNRGMHLTGVTEFFILDSNAI